MQLGAMCVSPGPTVVDRQAAPYVVLKAEDVSQDFIDCGCSTVRHGRCASPSSFHRCDAPCSSRPGTAAAVLDARLARLLHQTIANTLQQGLSSSNLGMPPPQSQHEPFSSASSRISTGHLETCMLGRVFGIPSYHVQKLFSEVVGVRYVSTQAASDMSLVHTERVAAGATCQDRACTDLAVKVHTLLHATSIASQSQACHAWWP